MFHRKLLITIFAILLIVVALVDAKKSKKHKKSKEPKQFLTDLKSRETDPPNFVRLVLMRLIYGIAVQMGLDDRLSGVLNGAFVPPNADNDDYGGFGDLGDLGGELGGDLGGDLFDF